MMPLGRSRRTYRVNVQLLSHEDVEHTRIVLPLFFKGTYGPCSTFCQRGESVAELFLLLWRSVVVAHRLSFWNSTSQIRLGG
jgi:hypothetical protein